MSMIFLAAMMMGQAPAAAPQPAPVQQQAAQKAKPAQICEYIEVTGSRSKRRVCHDVNGSADFSRAGCGHTVGGVGGPGGAGAGSIRVAASRSVST